MMGWEKILGVNLMLITARGRRTGRPHRVLVDVLDHDENGDVYYIQSTYGEGADWVQNIKANPVFEAEVGRRRFKATAGRVPCSEAFERL